VAADSSLTPEQLTFTSDGIRLAGTLYRPAGEAQGGLVVCHGAGSRKENHALMGAQAAAAGLAALTFDFRGHGESDGLMDPDGWHDVAAAAETLLGIGGAPWAAARGASMGGCMLLLAARARPELFGSLVALCPADADSLLAGLDELERDEDDAADAAGTTAPGPGAGPRRFDPGYSGRFDSGALRPFLRGLDLVAVARGMRRVLLAHARDDDVVPISHSERLAAVLEQPTGFIVLDSGGHHGPGRSPEVARATLDWVVDNAPGKETGAPVHMARAGGGAGHRGEVSDPRSRSRGRARGTSGGAASPCG
jgi:pimeloyl-ACP methyl ester carboxylesterase